jgi:type IV pilus assembly protein PilB
VIVDRNTGAFVPDEPEAHGPQALAKLHNLPFVSLRDSPIGLAAAKALPMHVLLRAGAIVYRVDDDRLKVAIGDPANVQVLDNLRLASSLPMDFAVAPAHQIELELRRLSRGQEVVARAEAINDTLPILEEEEEIDTEADDGISEALPIKLVNSIIVQAGEEGASDIHFLPQADALVARIRVDGMIDEVERIPRHHASTVVTRIKVLAKLDIAEHRLPQDGRFSIRPKATGRLVDVRVAVLPTVDGEGVIMRLLDKSRRAPTLTEIGLSNSMQMEIEDAIYRPNGAVLVTGPTGSGKSTTVHAALVDIRRPEVNIVTIEDPVEYRLEGVYQMQVNRRAGLTFATALRAILRSDPDVVMVGEIRDAETAKITLEAALTGHSVLSTMHTNDAPSAVTRMNDLGVEPFVTASSISAVLAQRLVRRLCTECREPYEPSAGDLEFLQFPAEMIDRGITLYRQRGCVNCSKGYRGRTGIFQFMAMTPEIKQLVGDGASHQLILEAATRGGMRSIWADGLEKTAEGLTTIDELSRVVR